MQVPIYCPEQCQRWILSQIDFAGRWPQMCNDVKTTASGPISYWFWMAQAVWLSQTHLERRAVFLYTQVSTAKGHSRRPLPWPYPRREFPSAAEARLKRAQASGLVLECILHKPCVSQRHAPRILPGNLGALSVKVSIVV